MQLEILMPRRSNDFRSVKGTVKVAGVACVNVDGMKPLRDGHGLLHAKRVQLPFCLTLKDALDVGGGFTVADD